MSSAVSSISSTSAQTKSPPRHQYFVCPIYKDEPVPWDPYTKGEVLSHHTYLDYFGGVFAEMEKHLDRDGLTVYVTWHTDKLPSYGQDVVAVVMGDEWGKYPLYTDQVRAVFKMMGTDFPFEATPFRTPFQLTAVTALKYARTQLHRVPNVIQAWRDRRRRSEKGEGGPTPIFDVPIGYVNQDDLPLKSLSERKYDLYFSGSVSNSRFSWYSPQYWLRTPKDVSRTRLSRAMRQIQRAKSDLNVVLDVWDTYVPNAGPDETDSPERSYSEMMMDTRICPVPRGTRLETGRLYEAMRYGCVLITEPLPDRWYLRGLPTITIHDWANLPAIVSDLVEDRSRMQRLHKAVRQWWKTRCSEAAVGRYMAEKLRSVFGDNTENNRWGTEREGEPSSDEEL